MQSDYEFNEYFNEEDRKRLSRMLMLSRAESGLSQESVALEMGIAKKTVQNWERGISAPTLPQTIEWFRVMKIAAMPYFLQFMFPDIEGIGSQDSDNKLRKEIIRLIEALPPEGVRQLMFLFYGNHGSSPRGIMNLITAHLQTPLKYRLSHACVILNDYEIAAKTNTTCKPNNIQPDVEMLEKAITQGRHAVINGNDSYMLIRNRNRSLSSDIKTDEGRK